MKKYLLTDSCFYWGNSKKKRNKHWIEVVDLKTGTVKHIKSGSIIQVVKERK